MSKSTVTAEVERTASSPILVVAFELGEACWQLGFSTGFGQRSLVGLTPMPYDTGTTTREQGIGKDGSRWVRGIAIERAWAWLRFQPESALSQWYQRRFGHGSKRLRKIGIVALARKLLIALWHWVEHGVLPEGAVLKTTLRLA